MAVRILLLLAVLACLTVRQQAAWSSDVALWAVAVEVNRTSPRPALNYAIALRKQARWDEASVWLQRAADRAAGHEREADYRQAVGAQFFAMELSGHFLCDSPSVRPYCFSEQP